MSRQTMFQVCNFVNFALTSSQKKWENKLNFTDIDINSINMRKDLPKVEKFNQIKINIHIWKTSLEGVAYNRRQSTYKKF